MPKYKCTNVTCSKYNETESISSTRITIVNGTALDRNAYCPICGDLREVVREEGITTNIAGTNDQRNRMAKQW